MGRQLEVVSILVDLVLLEDLSVQMDVVQLDVVHVVLPVEVCAMETT